MTDQSNRKFPRANYPCLLTIWKKEGYGTILANTANIGAGGVLVHLSESLMINAKVEIKIDFIDRESLRCDGLVLRCQRNKEDPDEYRAPYSVAIVFEKLEEEKTKLLNEIINKLVVNESTG